MQEPGMSSYKVFAVYDAILQLMTSCITYPKMKVILSILRVVGLQKPGMIDALDRQNTGH